MNPYGNTRYENAACRHGCCHGKYVTGYKCTRKFRTNGDKACIRRSRKRARQQVLEEIQNKPARRAPGPPSHEAVLSAIRDDGADTTSAIAACVGASCLLTAVVLRELITAKEVTITQTSGGWYQYQIVDIGEVQPCPT